MEVSAQSTAPGPLSAEDRRRLTWEDATERLLDAAAIGAGEWPHPLARLKDSLTWPLINVAVGAPPCGMAAHALHCVRPSPSNQVHLLTLLELLSPLWPENAMVLLP